MGSVILALIEQPRTARSLLAAADCLAGLAGAARVNVLVIRTPPVDTILPSEEVLTSGQQARVRAAEQARVDAAKAVFEPWRDAATGRGYTTQWIDVEGHADGTVVEHGSRADVIVIKRPEPREPDAARAAIHAALFDTGRPVLLVPPERPVAPFGADVAVAWREDARTAGAILSALRWIGRATRVDVLAGVRAGAPGPALPPLFEEHGIAARLHGLTVDGQQAFGAALLAQAHALGSDLLIMGAFARHPWRSLILGGVTRYMLTHADLPVLMRH